MTYVNDINLSLLSEILARYGLILELVDDHADIPHSYWGAPEAGRAKNTLYVRSDTPIHSILHEASHYVCMSATHRTRMTPDAAKNTREENATCYLQLLLADELQGFNREQQMLDMDEWGYSFRLGSSSKWFYEDAEDAKNWLLENKIIEQNCNITWHLRN